MTVRFADAEVLSAQEAAAVIAAAPEGRVKVVDVSGCTAVVEELRRLDAERFVGYVALAFDGPAASTGLAESHDPRGGHRADDRPVIWLPVLRDRNDGLRRLLDELEPALTLPVVPSPACDARRSDDSIVAAARLLEEAGVEPDDLVYASDRTPLDLYRSLAALHDQLDATYTPAGARLVVTPRVLDAHGLAAALAAFEHGAELAFAGDGDAGEATSGRDHTTRWLLWVSAGR